MRVKLDENIPTSAARPLRGAGHDIDTVIDENLSGADDADVLRPATTADRLVVTLDRGFGDILSYPPGSTGASSSSAPADQSPAAVVSDLERLRSEVDLAELGRSIAVFRDGELRVRRPRRVAQPKSAHPVDGQVAFVLVAASRARRRSLATPGFVTDALAHNGPAPRAARGLTCPSQRESRVLKTAWSRTWTGRELPIQLPVSTTKPGVQDVIPCASATV